MNKPSGTRRWALRGLLLLGVGLLVWTLYQQQDTVVQVLSHRWDLRLFALAVGCVAGAEMLTAIRWYVLLRAVSPVAWAEVWRLSLAGVAFNSCVPIPNGGDLVKAGLILGGDGPRTIILSSLILNRVIGLVGLFLLGSLAGVIWTSLPPEVQPLLSGIWVTTGVGVVGLVALFVPGLAHRLSKAAEWCLMVRPLAEQLAIAAEGYRTAWPRVCANLGLSIIGHLITIIGIYLTSLMLFPELPPPVDGAALITPVLMAIAVLPGGGLGIAEQISQQLFELVGYQNGAFVMVGYRVARLGAEVLAALVYILQRSRTPIVSGKDC